MSEPTPESKKRYQELMRNAGERKRALSARAMDAERRFRAEQRRIAQQRTQAERTDRVQRDLRRHAENLHLAAQIDHELMALLKKLAATVDREERVLLKAEIVHLRTIKANLRGNSQQKAVRKPPRKPPEAGIAMPPIPPHGPRPMQGGAAAPLDFGSD